MLTDLEPTLSLTPAPSALAGRHHRTSRLTGLTRDPDALMLAEHRAHRHARLLSSRHQGGAHKPTRMLSSMLELATHLTVLAGPHETDEARPHDDTRVLRLGALWAAGRTPDSPMLLARAVSEIDATTVDAIVGWTCGQDAGAHRDATMRAKRRIMMLTQTVETIAPEHGIDLTRAAMRYVTAHRTAA